MVNLSYQLLVFGVFIRIHCFFIPWRKKDFILIFIVHVIFLQIIIMKFSFFFHSKHRSKYSLTNLNAWWRPLRRKRNFPTNAHMYILKAEDRIKMISGKKKKEKEENSIIWSNCWKRSSQEEADSSIERIN